MYKIFFWFMLGYITRKNVAPVLKGVILRQADRALANMDKEREHNGGASREPSKS